MFNMHKKLENFKKDKTFVIDVVDVKKWINYKFIFLEKNSSSVLQDKENWTSMWYSQIMTLKSILDL